MSFNVYTAADKVSDNTRWLIEFNLLPAAKRGNRYSLVKLKEFYDSTLNPHTPVNLQCGGCVIQMFEVIDAIINYWNK